jgi:hypothetical protein
VVQCFDLKERLSSFSGDVWVQPLAQPLAPAAEARLKRFAAYHHAQRTPFAYVKGARAAWIPVGQQRLRVTSRGQLRVAGAGRPSADRRTGPGAPIKFYCAEFVGLCLREAGVLAAGVNPSRLVPRDVCLLPCLGPHRVPVRQWDAQARDVVRVAVRP